MESPRGLNDPALGRISEVAGEADYVLCIGKPVDFTLGFADSKIWRKARTWDVVLADERQLERARNNLGNRLQVALDADPCVAAWTLAEMTTSDVNRSGWIERVRDALKARVKPPETDAISPVDICSVVQATLDQAQTPILVADGGEFGQWAQSGVKAKRRIINGVSGMIGGSLGYAMGAKAARPDATVIAMMGDGTVGFHLSEFETAARSGLPFVAVIGNDRRWNAEHLIQLNSFGSDRLIGCDLSAARYDLAVAALGGFGAHVTDKDQLAPALAEAVASRLPACVNVEMESFPAPVFQ